jgi:outer membrane protein, multidrug efflux system
MQPKPFLIAAASALLLGGCAVGPQYRQPAVPTQAAFINGTNLFTASASNLAWWKQFNDPLLEQLIVRASTNNHDLRVAEARLREARALWKHERLEFLPTVRSENRYQNFRNSKDVSESRDRDGELYRAGFDATWELDLWGRVRRNVEASRATVESVQATRDDVLVSVQAEVAANYLQLRGVQAQLEVATRNATNQAETLRLAEALRDGGQGTQFDVARARSLFNATSASIPPLQAALEQAAYRIAVLCGQPPATLRDELLSTQTFPQIPSELGVSNPTELLRNRPDVRAAERSLAAATARIGVEVADLFPSVTFVGTIGLQASTFSGLSESGADTFGFGPHLSWAAFDLGRVRQRIKAADARADAALAVYEQTVLLALEETESALVSLQRERERLTYLTEAERAAAEATELARQRYRDGVADFLSVLDAERTLLSLQEQLVTTRTLSATRLIAVFKSFAPQGGSLQ